MHKRYESSPGTSKGALIIGKTDRRLELVKYHLADYFGEVELLADIAQLNSLTTDKFAIIVVTDTFGDVLKPDFFVNLRSLNPHAGLLCLFDRISRQTEKNMRGAGLLYLDSYEHFDDCYGSILERALWPQKTRQHQLQPPSNKPLNANGAGKNSQDRFLGTEDDDYDEFVRQGMQASTNFGDNC